MDANMLLELFSGTLQPDPVVRGAAEEQLRHLSLHQPGFLGACLDILTETQVHAAIRKASAVYLKNRVVKFWVQSGSHPQGYAIDPDEKPVVRERILDAIIGSDYATKQQLIPVLRVLVSADFAEWTDLIERTGHLLTQTVGGDAANSALYTGLLTFSEICRKFRWMENRDRATQLYPIIEQVFPHLLAVGNAIVDGGTEQMSEQIAEMLKLILKAYKFVTFFDLPEPLRSREQVVKWGELHGKIINLPTPNYVNDHEDQEKSMLQISKCYKWSVANVLRLFTRYASESSMSMKFSYKDFKSMFAGEFVPHLLNNYLQIIEQWCSGTRWLSSTTLYQLIQFFSHCVTQKLTWAQMKGYVDQLITHLVWPILCPDDSQLEMFEEDPHEYIHLYFDFNDEFDSPEIAATGLLFTLVERRRSVCLEPMVLFCVNKLRELGSQSETVEIAKQKEGVFCMLGSVSHIVVSSYGSQMESILAEVVLPAMSSKYGFLKARAIELVSKYAEVNFTREETLRVMFHGILSSFQSGSPEQSPLPVAFCSALAIQGFISHPEFRPILGNIVLQVMSRLLELANDIDNDMISVVMQECVENYSEQLQGYGVDLMVKLTEQFMRLARDVSDQQNQYVDEVDFNEGSDKIMAATGLLATMITILLSFENSREVCLKLEEVTSPAIEFCLKNQLDDFLGEIAELVENSTFLLQWVSPITWSHFPGLVECFSSRIALLYLENLVPCLQNMLVYGSDDLCGPRADYVPQFYKVFECIVEDASNEDDFQRQDEYIQGCSLAQTFLLSLKEKAKPYVPSFLTAAMKMAAPQDGATLEEPKNTSFDVNVHNVLLACVIADLHGSLQHIAQNQNLELFFQRWYQINPKLTRVFDIKLAILALVAVMRDSAVVTSSPAAVISEGAAQLATLVHRLPGAQASLEKRKKEFSAFDMGQTSFNFSGGDLKDFEEETSFPEGGDADAGEEEYLDFLESEEYKSAGYYDKYDEEPIEDPLASTPLDKLDVLAIFKEFSASSTGQQIFSSLSPEEQRLLQ
ncbi:nonsense-mediated mRNA decay protein 5 [Diutina catenulata]